MSDELERRLRDSLRAYADLVDEPETVDLPTRTASPAPRAGLRGWRGALLGAAAAAAVVSGSFWVITSDGDRPVAAGSDAASVASGAEAAAGEPEGDTLAADAAAAPGETRTLPTSPEVGVAYPLDLYTHCGVLGIDVGGIWFAADPPLVDGAGNPPAGWGNPYQRGTLTLLTAEEAVFADGAGHEVRLGADDPARPGPCD